MGNVKLHLWTPSSSYVSTTSWRCALNVTSMCWGTRARALSCPRETIHSAILLQAGQLKIWGRWKVRTRRGWHCARLELHNFLTLAPPFGTPKCQRHYKSKSRWNPWASLLFRVLVLVVLSLGFLLAFGFKELVYILGPFQDHNHMVRSQKKYTPRLYVSRTAFVPRFVHSLCCKTKLYL